MKRILETYYKIKIDEIKKENNYFLFDIDYNTYYFIPTTLSDNNIIDIMKLVNESLYLNSVSHEFIKNIYNQYITDGYLLLKIIGVLNVKCDVKDLIDFNENTYVVKSDKVNWSQLWSEKVDYFEYQIREIGKDKSIIQDSLSYYLGMAENAIFYVNKVNNYFEVGDLDKYCITHTRIYCPNYKVNFYNPLSYIVDLEIRDFCEYIKSLFFNGEEVNDIILDYLSRKQFGEYSYHLFFARMLYPSYYFDVYEKVILNELDEDSIIMIIDRVKDYEKLLINIKKYLNNYIQTFVIDWLH